MKIRPVGAELFHADGQTNIHDEASSLFSQMSGATIYCVSAMNPHLIVNTYT